MLWHSSTFFFNLCLLIPGFYMFLFYFTWFFFQNKRWILIVGWYRQKYRYATVRRSHALLNFFFLRLLLCLKFKPLLRSAYVRYFNLCPESLDAKTGQFASLLGRGWEGMDWEGMDCEGWGGGVSLGFSLRDPNVATLWDTGLVCKIRHIPIANKETIYQMKIAHDCLTRWTANHFHVIFDSSYAGHE